MESLEEVSTGLEASTSEEKVLIQHLKQLEADGLLIREAKPVVPPFVTYQLSESGKKLLPVIHAMATWAFEHQEKHIDMEGK